MFRLAEKALEICEKADFADIRIIDERRRNLGVRNGEIYSLSTSSSVGFGIRVLYRGYWGFASGVNLTPKGIALCASSAMKIAESGTTFGPKKTALSPEPVWKDFWQTPFMKDPFLMDAGKMLETLFLADKILRSDKRIKKSFCEMHFIKERQWHLTSEGSRIEQLLLSSGAGMGATAVNGTDVQIRTYPSSHGGHTQGGGYEVIEALGLENEAERVKGEAISLLKAPACPCGEKDLIIGGNQLALQIHESVGHATELDRVLGYEESYAGSSFATLEKLGKFKYGSPVVNLVADATLPGGLATAGYDDDAVKAQRWHIVKDGILSGYMTNREFAAKAGGKRSMGSCRADGFSNIPITRICNLSLMPGNHSLQEMTEEIKDGIIMDNNKSWSIDQRRLNFQFGCEAGWLIKNGKKKQLVKNPVYQGITPHFWNSCDAIAGPEEWRLYGVTNCGKGQPGQTAMMSHGSSPARFRKVKISN